MDIKEWADKFYNNELALGAARTMEAILRQYSAEELANLTELDLSGNRVADPQPLSGLANLKWLDLIDLNANHMLDKYD